MSVTQLSPSVDAPPASAAASRGVIARRVRLLAAAAGAAWAWWAVARVTRDTRAYLRAAGRLRDLEIPVDGRLLRARVGGPRRSRRRGDDPLVFVHGYGVSSAYWVPLAARLASEYQVYVLDLPGRAAQNPAGPATTVPALARRVLASLDALGLTRVTLVANSMGCQTATEVAARHPSRVGALVLVGPTVDATASSGWRQAGRLALSAPFERLVLDAIVVADYVRAGPRLLADELRAMLAHRVEQVLPLVQAPTLVIRGEHDQIAPMRWAVEVGRLARADAVLEIADAGHAAHFDEPRVVAAAIRAFLRRRARGQADRRP